jgi:hypothetical protein
VVARAPARHVMNDDVRIEMDDATLEIMAAEEVLFEKGALVGVMVPVTKDERECIGWGMAENGRWEISSFTIDENKQQRRVALLKAAPDVRARAVPVLITLVREVGRETARIFEGAAQA